MKNSRTEGQVSSPEISVFLPGSASDISVLDNFENELGVKFKSVKWYLDWSDDLETEIPNRFNDHGAIPELTWQPQLNVEGISYDDVTAGKHDSYIKNFAEGIKNLGYPIRISLAPEMNSDWEPWGIGQKGNNNENHKTFWRYVVGKFRDNGVDNVTWIWTPNIHYGGETYSKYSDLYPGDDYVDYIGLDGYNWGTSQAWSSWQSFKEVFESSYNDVLSMTGKDILIMETASTEQGGNKADWITEMFRTLNADFPKIKGFTWFSINKETDWRIDSSDASKQAFIKAAQGESNSTDTNETGSVPAASSNSSQNTNSSQSSNSSEKTESKKTKEAKDNPQSPTPDQEQISTSTPTIFPPQEETYGPIVEGAWAYNSDSGKETAVPFIKLFEREIFSYLSIILYILLTLNLWLAISILLHRIKKQLFKKSKPKTIKQSYLVDGIARISRQRV